MPKEIQYQSKYLGKIIEFNKRSFPLRKGIEQSFEERFFKNPFNENSILNCSFVSDDDDRILGQFLVMANRFYFGNKTFNGNWGFDFIIDEELRGKKFGKTMAEKVMKCPNYSVVGISKASEAIHLKNGNIEVGTAQRFIKQTSFSAIFLSIIQKSKPTIYLKEFSSEDVTVNLITDTKKIKAIPNWNTSILEWDRSLEFLKWRFFAAENKYGFYQSEKENFYFVVREVIWKNMKVLLLVDYRYKIEEAHQFQNILKLAHNMAKKMNCAALLNVSSFEKTEMFKSGFRKFGEPLQIMTTADFTKKNPAVLLTFADSDLDTFYGDNIW